MQWTLGILALQISAGDGVPPPHSGGIVQAWTPHIADALKLGSRLGSMLSMDRGCYLFKIKFREKNYQQEKGSMLLWRPPWSQCPSSKFLLVPGIRNQPVWISQFKLDPGRILKSPRCPLSNHILTVPWGSLCWKKKIIAPHSPVYLFFDKNLHSIFYESDFYSDFFIY